MRFKQAFIKLGSIGVCLGATLSMATLAVGCLGGASTTRTSSQELTSSATVAFRGDDGFSLAELPAQDPQTETQTEPQPLALNDWLNVAIEYDPSGAPSLLVLTVRPDVEHLTLKAASVSEGGALLFAQGGHLGPQAGIKTLWSRTDASSERWEIPLAPLWEGTPVQGLLALEVEITPTSSALALGSSHVHRQLLNLASFDVAAFSEGPAIYGQVKRRAPLEPLSEISIEVLDDQGRTLARGLTSSDGLLKLTNPLFEQAASRLQPLFIVARKGRERAFAPVTLPTNAPQN